MKTALFEFARRRDFGTVIGDALQFFTRNFKSFFLGFLIYVGPFFLLGSLFMVYAGLQLQNLMTVSLGFQFGLESLAFLPCILFASVMMMAFVCAMAQKHQQTYESPLVENIWPYVRKNIWPACVAFAVVFGLIGIPYIALIALAVALNAGVAIVILIILSIPFLIYLIVPLTIFMISHVLEGNSVTASLRRGFYLVRERWWLTFGVYLVLSICASIASYVLIIPAYIIFFIKTLGSIETGEMADGFGMWVGIMYSCGMLGSLFAGMFQMTGMILQFYSLRELKEGTSLMKRIEQLDQQGTEPLEGYV